MQLSQLVGTKAYIISHWMCTQNSTKQPDMAKQEERTGYPALDS